MCSRCLNAHRKVDVLAWPSTDSRPVLPSSGPQRGRRWSSSDPKAASSPAESSPALSAGLTDLFRHKHPTNEAAQLSNQSWRTSSWATADLSAEAGAESPTAGPPGVGAGTVAPLLAAPNAMHNPGQLLGEPVAQLLLPTLHHWGLAEKQKTL